MSRNKPFLKSRLPHNGRPKPAAPYANRIRTQEIAATEIVIELYAEVRHLIEPADLITLLPDWKAMLTEARQFWIDAGKEYGVNCLIDFPNAARNYREALDAIDAALAGDECAALKKAAGASAIHAKLLVNHQARLERIKAEAAAQALIEARPQIEAEKAAAVEAAAAQAAEQAAAQALAAEKQAHREASVKGEVLENWAKEQRIIQQVRELLDQGDPLIKNNVAAIYALYRALHERYQHPEIGTPLSEEELADYWYIKAEIDKAELLEGRDERTQHLSKWMYKISKRQAGKKSHPPS